MTAPLEWWCGAAGTTGIMSRTLSPCWFDSGAGALLLLVALACFLVQGLSTRAWRRSWPAVSLTGMTGMEAAVLLLSLLLGIIHLGQLVYCLIYLRDLPFHIAFQATLLGTWASLAVAQADAASCHAPTKALRPLLLLAPPLYAWLVYSGMVLYLGGGGDPFPPVYARTSVWNAMMSAAFGSLAALAAFKQVPPVNPDGYAPLPGDVEAGASINSSKGEEAATPRTWAALFVDACTYAWPDSPLLQLRVLLCVVLLLLMRVINLAVPVTYKRLVDQLAGASASEGGPGERPSFWQLLQPWEVLYLAAIFFQGGAGGGITGFVNNLRQWLWIPVSQDAYRRVSLAVFAHVLDLDLSFHLRRKTGEVTKVVDRGTAAIQNVLSTIVFSIAPQVVDMLVAATYLAAALEPWVALIVFITIGSYIPLTIAVTEWRGSFRRTMNSTDNAKSARVTDALLNWETVKYFTNEPLEERRYGEAIDAYQGAEYAFLSSLNVLNVTQSGIMFLGISSGMLACTAGVARGTMTVGDVVLFLTLMAQLYGPLNFFGTYYRVIQQYMIDMENLLQLLDTSGKVHDAPGAKDLVLGEGRVDFHSVSFAYEPAMPVLKSVSFSAPGGSTVAFVGATGSGKSTLTRLLFRFFDVTGGAITIDGQDVRQVTQSSLRAAIGMVPQDCVLFNDTIRYNIQYGNMAAGPGKVEEAAQAACIHDTIAGRFPKGYETVVGERGLRLSGGEKQRVAFARALLKNPPLLVLDEATSALDTITEKRIQAALSTSRSRRTTFIVAHRLSTIADADLIVVLKEGDVVESGSHEQLLDAGGVYAELWSKQAHTSASVDDIAAAAGGKGSSASLAALGGGGGKGSSSSLAAAAAAEGGQQSAPAGSSSAAGPRHHG